MDIQRLVAAVIFSLSLLWLWEAWQQYNQPTPVTASATAELPAVVPQQAPAALPTAAPATEGQLQSAAQAVIETDILRAVIDANGGDIRELVLTRFTANGDASKPFTLFEAQPGRNYVAQSGLAEPTSQGLLPHHKTRFELVPGTYRLEQGKDQISLTLRAQEGGVELQKTYVFKRGSYVIEMREQVVNRASAAVTASAYYQLRRHGQPPEGESKMMYTFTGPAIYTEAGKFQKVNFEDIAKSKTDHATSAQDGWAGMVQHHFVSAWLMPTRDDATQRNFFTRSLGNDEYAVCMVLPGFTLQPGEQKQLAMRLYAGPQELEMIEPLANGMQFVVDYGWLTVLASPLFTLLKWIHNLIPNWGWAIIVLTVLIKGAFYPLSAASYKSMAKMRKLAPRLQQIKERYGDDRQKLHEHMMKIYQEEKINPLGGCLPILVQIPVFIALYWVLMGAVELRQAPWALWIHDLSASDPYYILPVLMAISMFIQQKLSPAPADPVQAKVMLYMPLIFSVFFFFFPAGLVLYWLVNNLLSILQQWRINQVIERAR